MYGIYFYTLTRICIYIYYMYVYLYALYFLMICGLYPERVRERDIHIIYIYIYIHVVQTYYYIKGNGCMCKEVLAFKNVPERRMAIVQASSHDHKQCVVFFGCVFWLDWCTPLQTCPHMIATAVLSSLDFQVHIYIKILNI